MAEPIGVLYDDTSALVKLAVEEPETQALRIELNRWDTVATSVITEIEPARAVARARERGTTTLDDVAVWTLTAAPNARRKRITDRSAGEPAQRRRSAKRSLMTSSSATPGTAMPQRSAL